MHVSGGGEWCSRLLLSTASEVQAPGVGASGRTRVAEGVGVGVARHHPVEGKAAQPAGRRRGRLQSGRGRGAGAIWARQCRQGSAAATVAARAALLPPARVLGAHPASPSPAHGHALCLACDLAWPAGWRRQVTPPEVACSALDTTDMLGSAPAIVASATTIASEHSAASVASSLQSTVREVARLCVSAAHGHLPATQPAAGQLAASEGAGSPGGTRCTIAEAAGCPKASPLCCSR